MESLTGVRLMAKQTIQVHTQQLQVLPLGSKQRRASLSPLGWDLALAEASEPWGLTPQNRDEGKHGQSHDDVYFLASLINAPLPFVSSAGSRWRMAGSTTQGSSTTSMRPAYFLQGRVSPHVNSGNHWFQMDKDKPQIKHFQRFG